MENILLVINIILAILLVLFVLFQKSEGGALGIGVGDKVVMLENTWYSVISPESCSSILWRSWEYKEQAADALKLTSKDMSSNKLVDDVIKEPIDGAHRSPKLIFDRVKKQIKKYIQELEEIPAEKRIEQRIEKFDKMGVWK